MPQVLKRLASDKRMPVDAYDRSDTQLLASGNLLTADNQIDTTTGTDKLKAVFDNKDSVLFPNQFVNIHLILENRPNALVVPSAAIQTGLNGSLFVWVINDDGKGGHSAQMQTVKVALAEGQNTILDSGPAPGAKVVIDGADRSASGPAGHRCCSPSTPTGFRPTGRATRRVRHGTARQGQYRSSSAEPQLQ